MQEFFLVCWPVGAHSRVRSQASIALQTLAFLGVHPGAVGSVSLSSVRCCLPTISSVTADHDDLCELPPRREAGSLINRSVTIRTKARFRHPRTDGTALLLSTTTELLVIDLVAQHDPQANAQLAGHRRSGFPQALLY